MASAILGADELKRRFDAISSPRTRRAFLRDYGLQTTRLAKLTLRRHRKTGNTSRSGTIDVRDSSVEVAFEGAAVFLERGTRPHRIRARRAKALRFVAGGSAAQVRLTGTPRRGASGVSFAKSVEHPGTRADPFLLPAARAALKSAGIQSRIVKEWDDAA